MKKRPKALPDDTKKTKVVVKKKKSPIKVLKKPKALPDDTKKKKTKMKIVVKKKSPIKVKKKKRKFFPSARVAPE